MGKDVGEAARGGSRLAGVARAPPPIRGDYPPAVGADHPGGHPPLSTLKGKACFCRARHPTPKVMIASASRSRPSRNFYEI